MGIQSVSVRDAFIDRVRKDNELDGLRHRVQSEGKVAKLWPSDIGGCIRKTILRIHGVDETHPFDDYVLELFDSGNVWERRIIRALGDAAIPGVLVGDDLWSGKIDAVVIEAGRPIVVEIKDTADYNFRAKDRLPYESHVLQAAVYARLLRAQTDMEALPSTILYYHGRCSFAEFDLRIGRTEISFVGEINNRDRFGAVMLSLEDEMGRMEMVLDAYREQGDIPEQPYQSPFEERFACAKQSSGLWWPACTYFGHCWEIEGGFPISEESNYRSRV